MSNKWVDRNLDKAVTLRQADAIRDAVAEGQVGKKLLHIDCNGYMTEYALDSSGKII